MNDSGLLPKLILIIILTGVNAFFASAEMAMVSVSSSKIKKLRDEGDERAQILLDISKDQTRFLSTIQVAITLAGFFSSGSAATSISKVFGNYLTGLGIPYGPTIAFILITFILSYITLVFGELVPKRIALGNSEKVALRSAKPIALASKIFYPFVKLLSLSTSLVLKLMGKYDEDVEEKISEEELKSYVKVSSQQGVINRAGEEMIVNIMDFDDTLADEIMTPRTSVYMVDFDEFSKATIKEILDRGYSRIPVYRKNHDNIVGIINIKDIFIDYASDHKIEIDNILKEAYFVPETKKIDMLLKDMQESKNYMAILIDEYGGFSGIVTVEDIVEEIVGEIEDEYDEDPDSFRKLSENEYIVDGDTDLDDINDRLGTYLYSDNYETISGLIIEKLDFIPKDGESKNYRVKTCGCVLTELEVSDKKIKRASIKIIEEEQEEARRAYKTFNS